MDCILLDIFHSEFNRDFNEIFIIKQLARMLRKPKIKLGMEVI